MNEEEKTEDRSQEHNSKSFEDFVALCMQKIICLDQLRFSECLFFVRGADFIE